MRKIFALLLFSLLTINLSHAQIINDDLQRITPDNADQVEELAILSHGYVGEVAWSPDGLILAVADSIGVWLYDAQDWSAEPRLLARFDNETGNFLLPLIEYSPDGRILAFSAGSNIRLWDMERNAELALLNTATREVHGFTFSPDGSTLVASIGFAMEFWDAQTWELEKTWVSPQTNDYIRFGVVTYSPDGSILATNGNDTGNLHLWDPTMETIEEAHIIELGQSDNEERVSDIDFSPDGAIVVSATTNFGVVQGFRTDTFEEVIVVQEGGVRIEYSPDGNLLATAPLGFTPLGPYIGPSHVYLHDTTSNTIVSTWTDHESVHYLDFSPDGSTLVAVSRLDESIHLWDVELETEIAIIQQSLGIRSIEFTPDDSLLMTSAIVSGGIGLVDLSTGQALFRYPRIAFAAIDSILNADGEMLIAYYQQPDVILRNVIQNQEFIFPVGSRYALIRFSPDGSILATSNRENILRFWDTRTGSQVNEIRLQASAEINNVYISPDNHQAIISSDIDESFTRIVVSVETGDIINELSVTGPIQFHPTQYIVANLSQNRMSVIEPATGESLFSADGFNIYGYTSFMFSPSGDELILGDGDGNIWIWDAYDGTQRAFLDAHDNIITVMTITDDEELLITGDFEGTVHIWDYASLELLRTIDTGLAGVVQLVFNHANTVIAVATRQYVWGDIGSLTLWGIPSE